MGIIMDAFLGAGAWDAMGDAQRRRVMRGARDWGAQAASTAPFAPLDREAVRTITQPALLLTGDRTIHVHDLVDAELARLLPNARRVTVPNATHDMWADAPEFCRARTLEFLGALR
jgi:pimeloyl-ACP methyl ester carboxylesterase